MGDVGPGHLISVVGHQRLPQPEQVAAAPAVPFQIVRLTCGVLLHHDVHTMAIRAEIQLLRGFSRLPAKLR
mgnify:CR=1 FL=1